MVDANLEMLMIAVQRALDDLRLIKDSQTRTERRIGRIERLLADTFETQVDQEARVDRLAERIERIERRLDLRSEP